ncbi:hypothetical protein, partial [Klebsiella pneumoniae]|uniref:hypothetical protein n=1 Tax=Klebsiella pneumoniae TaxID=573 RepID=UPI0025A2D6E3
DTCVARDLRKWQIEPAAACSVVREREMSWFCSAEHTSEREREREQRRQGGGKRPSANLRIFLSLSLFSS